MSGMNWVTEPKLVAAVSNAGGLGIFGTSHCAPEDTRKNIRSIKELTDKPFGVNQSLRLPRAKENIEVILDEKVPVVNYSMGKPWFIEAVHRYGGMVIGTIAIARHAAKAEQLGVDAIVITGHEAAAHGGDVTIMVLIPIVAGQTKVPIIAAGGFFEGRGLAAALVLGADAISMGTRFMLTKESIVHENFKKLCFKASEQDTIYSDVFDGMPSRMLKSKKSEYLFTRGGHFPLIKAIAGGMEIKRALKLSAWEFAKAAVETGSDEEKTSIFRQGRLAAQAIRYQQAMYEGDLNEGVIAAGQCVGGIRDLPTCKELIERIVSEAEKSLRMANETLGK